MAQPQKPQHLQFSGAPEVKEYIPDEATPKDDPFGWIAKQRIVSTPGSMYSYASTRGYLVENLKGKDVVIRQRWLVEWVQELKSRLPPFQFQELGIEEDAETLPVAEIQRILSLLPQREVDRFNAEYSRHVLVMGSLAELVRPELVDKQVKDALQRHRRQHQERIDFLTNKALKEQEDKAKDPPWLFAMNAFNSRVNAAVTIQRRFRVFRAQCEEQGWYPSDENPKHWKHWADFRQKHGWSYEEMFDEYGQPIERTDGGAWKKGRMKPMPHLNKAARYMEAIHNIRDQNIRERTQASLLEEAANAMRTYARAQRLAELLNDKWKALQDREARRAKWRAEAEARRRAAAANNSEYMSESEPEDDLDISPEDLEKQRAEYLSFISDPEVRKLLQEGLQISGTTFVDSLTTGLAPGTSADAAPNTMPHLLSSFLAAHQYRQDVAAAKAQGLLPPAPPKGLDAEVLSLYSDIMDYVHEAYKLDLERALREGREPPAPPKGAARQLVELYKEAMDQMKRLESLIPEEGQDTGGVPRVHELSPYGQSWLMAMEQSTATRRRLLRTRSQGNLGLQNAALYRAPGVVPTPKFQKSQSIAPNSHADGDASKAPAAPEPSDGEAAGAAGTQESPQVTPHAAPKRRFSFKDLSPEYATTLQPLTARAAFKLHASVAFNHARQSRPLVVVETQQLAGMQWLPAAQQPEGQGVVNLVVLQPVDGYVAPPLPDCYSHTAAVPLKQHRSQKSSARQPVGQQGEQRGQAQQLSRNHTLSFHNFPEQLHSDGTGVREMRALPSVFGAIMSRGVETPDNEGSANVSRQDLATHDRLLSFKFMNQLSVNTAGQDDGGDVSQAFVSEGAEVLQPSLSSPQFPSWLLGADGKLSGNAAHDPGNAQRIKHAFSVDPSMESPHPVPTPTSPSFRVRTGANAMAQPALPYILPMTNPQRADSAALSSRLSKASNARASVTGGIGGRMSRRPSEQQGMKFTSTKVGDKSAARAAHAVLSHRPSASSEVVLSALASSQDVTASGILDQPIRRDAAEQNVDSERVSISSRPSTPGAATSPLPAAGLASASAPASRPKTPIDAFNAAEQQVYDGGANHMQQRAASVPLSVALGQLPMQDMGGNTTSTRLSKFAGASGPGKAASLWARARTAVQQLLASYPPEVTDALREAGISSNVGPTQLLDRTMALLRTPKTIQLEDGGAIIKAKSRPLSAGTPRDIDALASAAVARHGAAASTVADSRTNTLGLIAIPAKTKGKRGATIKAPQPSLPQHASVGLSHLVGGGMPRSNISPRPSYNTSALMSDAVSTQGHASVAQAATPRSRHKAPVKGVSALDLKSRLLQVVTEARRASENGSMDGSRASETGDAVSPTTATNTAGVGVGVGVGGMAKEYLPSPLGTPRAGPDDQPVALAQRDAASSSRLKNDSSAEDAVQQLQQQQDLGQEKSEQASDSCTKSEKRDREHNVGRIEDDLDEDDDDESLYELLGHPREAPQVGWSEVSRCISMGGLSRAASRHASRHVSRAASRAHILHDSQGSTAHGGSKNQVNRVRPSGKPQPEHSEAATDESFIKNDTDGEDDADHDSDDGRSHLRSQISDLIPDDLDPKHGIGEPEANTFAMIGPLIADAFLQQQRLARTERQAAEEQEQVRKGKKPGSVFPSSQIGQLRGVGLVHALSPEETSLALQRSCDVASQSQHDESILMATKHVKVHRLSARSRRNMQAKYFQMYKGQQYSWLNQQLRMGVLPDQLTWEPPSQSQSSQDNGGQRISHTGQPRASRATQLRQARLSYQPGSSVSGVIQGDQSGCTTNPSPTTNTQLGTQGDESDVPQATTDGTEQVSDNVKTSSGQDGQNEAADAQGMQVTSSTQQHEDGPPAAIHGAASVDNQSTDHLQQAEQAGAADSSQESSGGGGGAHDAAAGAAAGVEACTERQGATTQVRIGSKIRLGSDAVITAGSDAAGPVADHPHHPHHPHPHVPRAATSGTAAVSGANAAAASGKLRPFTSNLADSPRCKSEGGEHYHDVSAAKRYEHYMRHRGGRTGNYGTSTSRQALADGLQAASHMLPNTAEYKRLIAVLKDLKAADMRDVSGEAQRVGTDSETASSSQQRSLLTAAPRDWDDVEDAADPGVHAWARSGGVGMPPAWFARLMLRVSLAQKLGAANPGPHTHTQQNGSLQGRYSLQPKSSHLSPLVTPCGNMDDWMYEDFDDDRAALHSAMSVQRSAGLWDGDAATQGLPAIPTCRTRPVCINKGSGAFGYESDSHVVTSVVASPAVPVTDLSPPRIREEKTVGLLGVSNCPSPRPPSRCVSPHQPLVHMTITPSAPVTPRGRHTSARLHEVAGPKTGFPCASLGNVSDYACGSDMDVNGSGSIMRSRWRDNVSRASAPQLQKGGPSPVSSPSDSPGCRREPAAPANMINATLDAVPGQATCSSPVSEFYADVRSQTAAARSRTTAAASASPTAAAGRLAMRASSPVTQLQSKQLPFSAAAAASGVAAGFKRTGMPLASVLSAPVNVFVTAKERKAAQISKQLEGAPPLISSMTTLVKTKRSVGK